VARPDVFVQCAGLAAFEDSASHIHCTYFMCRGRESRGRELCFARLQRSVTEQGRAIIKSYIATGSAATMTEDLDGGGEGDLSTDIRRPWLCG
jgi:hypothetical protein